MQPLDIGYRQHSKICFGDAAGVGPTDRCHDELKRTREELGGALHLHVVAVIKRRKFLVRCIPHPAGDRAAPVGQFDLQIELPVSIGA